MSTPPYPPPGGAEPAGDRSGAPIWDPPGDDDPTGRFDAPGDEGQRNATQQFGPPPSVPPGQPSYGQQYAPQPYGSPDAPQGQPSPFPGYGPVPGGPIPYPEYGQQPYGPAPHTPYGQPAYGPPAYAQSSYGQPAYGQPPYAPPPYGQPPYGQPAGPGTPGTPARNRTTVIALTAGGILVLVVLAAALFFLVRAGDPGTASAGRPSSAGSGGMPEATARPDGLGDDAFLDDLARECFEGDMLSCDDLYVAADLDSRYGVYGGTCAGRQGISDADIVFCVDAFPED